MYMYMVKLQDMLSSPVMLMVKKVNTAFAGMENITKKVTGGMSRNWQTVESALDGSGNKAAKLRKELQSLNAYRNFHLKVDSSEYVEAGRKIDELSAKLKSLRGAENSVSGARGGGFGGGGGGFGRKAAGFMASVGGGLPGLLMAGGVYGAAAYGAIQTAQAAVQSTVVPAMGRETTRFQLNKLTGNPAFVNGLEKQFAAYAPDKMSELFSGSQKLVGAGVEQKDLFSTMKMLNNISALSNTKVDELAFIQSKIKATGYVQGDEMDMFRERGITLNPYIAKVMGIGMNEVKKVQEKGLITYEKFNKALEMYVGVGSKFQNVYEEKRDSTPDGRYQFLVGQFDERMLQLGLRTLPIVNRTLEYTSGLFDRIAPLGEPIIKLAGAFSPLLNSVGTLGRAFGILDKQSQLSTGFVTAMANTIGGFATIVEYVSKSIKWVVDQLFADTAFLKLLKGGANMMLPGTVEALKAIGKLNDQKADALATTVANKDTGLLSSALPFSENTNGGSKGGASLGDVAGLGATVGGTGKSVTIINIKSLIERYEPNVYTSINESVNDLEGKVIDVLLRVANSAGHVK